MPRAKEWRPCPRGMLRCRAYARVYLGDLLQTLLKFATATCSSKLYILYT